MAYKLKKLYIENFLSIEKTMITFDNDINLFNLIKGWNENRKISNGAGKSAILDAILFCLFKTTMRGRVNDRNKLNYANLIKKGKNQITIACELFDNDTNTKLKIIRKANDKTSNVHLTINDKQLKEMKNKNVDKKIQQLLLKNLDVFDFIRNNVFVSSNYHQFFSLSQEKKIQIIESLITQFDFRNLQDYIKTKAKNLLMEIENNTDIQKIKLEMEKLKELKNKYIDMINELNTENFDNQIEKEQKKLVTLENNIVNETKIQERINDEITNYKNEIENIVKKMMNLEGRKTKLTFEKKQIDKDIKNLSNLDDPICPFCKQEISQDHIEKELKKYNIQLKSLTTRLSNVKMEIKTYEIKIKDLNDKINVLNEKLNKSRLDIGVFQNNQIIINQKINELKEAKEKNNSKLQDEINKIESNLAELSKKLADFEGLKEIKKDELNKLNIFAKMFQNKSSFKVLFLNHIFDDLSALSNIILEKFGDHINLKLKWCFDKNNDINIYDELTNTFYFEMSSGEKRLVDMVVLFTFLEISMLNNKSNLNLLFMDEPFEHLDRLLTLRLIQLLRDFIYNHNLQLFFISHSKEIDDIFSIENEDYMIFSIDRMKQKILNHLNSKIRLIDNVLFSVKSKNNTQIFQILG